MFLTIRLRIIFSSFIEKREIFYEHYLILLGLIGGFYEFMLSLLVLKVILNCGFASSLSNVPRWPPWCTAKRLWSVCASSTPGGNLRWAVTLNTHTNTHRCAFSHVFVSPQGAILTTMLVSRNFSGEFSQQHYTHQEENLVLLLFCVFEEALLFCFNPCR